jgi:hypothetical protein
MPACSASACSSCERLGLYSALCMPWSETVRESRMREICMSGLKRAGAAGLPAPPLLYWFKSLLFSHHAVAIACGAGRGVTEDAQGQTCIPGHRRAG